MRPLIVFLLVVLFGSGNSAQSQQPANSIGSSDKADIVAYRVLFRQAALYKKLADQADTTSTPKPHLRRILATRYGFSDTDNASLVRIALAYQAEIAPIHLQAQAVIRKD